MFLQAAAAKVKREHVEKLAFIYVRQSTLQGVKKNITGGLRQREEMEQLALELGWPAERIKIIDDDQARSGSTTQGRFGYQDMLKAISKGCVGALFSLESTRVGRDYSDWHYLIKLCFVTGTLFIDPAGVYDASNNNDNTLMKVRSLAGEMELYSIRERLVGAKLKLAHEGRLRQMLPTGLLYSETGSIILDPNSEVQDAIRLAFDEFDRLGSALGVVRHFLREQVKFPSIVRSGPRQGEYDWVKPTEVRMLRISQNPSYAGAFVYGRSETKWKAVILPSGVPEIQKYRVPLPQNNWKIVIKDLHPAYISWSRFLQNLKRIRNNNPGIARKTGGATRAGQALLQGLNICGMCGYRMGVSYRASAHYYYRCNANIPVGVRCQIMPGMEIDRAVEQLFLQAIEPVQLAISLDAFQGLEHQSAQQDRRWTGQLKRAQATVANLKERLLCVDYHNKYAFSAVQEELAKREEELLRLVQEKESSSIAPITLSAADRNTIESLSRNLPLVWRSKTTDMVTKKNLLRCVIEDLTIKRTKRMVSVFVRWKSGATSELRVTLPNISERQRTEKAVLDRITSLLPGRTSAQIAQKLNEEGVKTQTGRDFNASRVASLCKSHGLKALAGALDADGCCSAAIAGKLLDVGSEQVRAWCRKGLLDAVLTESKRWRIKLPEPEIARIREQLTYRGLGRGVPPSDHPDWNE